MGQSRGGEGQDDPPRVWTFTLDAPTRDSGGTWRKDHGWGRRVLAGPLATVLPAVFLVRSPGAPTSESQILVRAIPHTPKIWPTGSSQM